MSESSPNGSKTDLSFVDPKQEKKINSLINKQIKEEAEEIRKNPVSKLLLLGPGDSGKTTVLKQMRILHGEGFSDADRKEFLPKVIMNVINSIKALVKASMDFNAGLLPENEKNAIIADALTGEEPLLKPEQINAIISLWKDPGIQKCYSRSNEFILQDTANYFLDKVETLTQPKYIPTDQDILMTRSRTLKVSETDFKIKAKIFRVIDVAGQKSSRPAWAVFFDDARAILFVASMACYDQFMEEDVNTNKMVDTMGLFDVTCNNPILKNVAMILLLNKSDLAEQKIKTSSIRKYFDDLNGKKSCFLGDRLEKKDETDFKVAKAYFRAKFEELNKNPKKYVYIHFTNSTDTNLMKVIIDACVDIIIRVMLDSAGMM